MTINASRACERGMIVAFAGTIARPGPGADENMGRAMVQLKIAGTGPARLGSRLRTTVPPGRRRGCGRSCLLGPAADERHRRRTVSRRVLCPACTESPARWWPRTAARHSVHTQGRCPARTRQRATAFAARRLGPPVSSHCPGWRRDRRGDGVAAVHPREREADDPRCPFASAGSRGLRLGHRLRGGAGYRDNLLSDMVVGQQ